MSDQRITTLLDAWRHGDNEALLQLTPLVYDELKRLASHYLRQEVHAHSLQTSALVHEAYIRLVEQGSTNFDGRIHFFGIVARLIRQILVDHARKHQACKRDSGGPLLSFDERFHFPGGEGQVDLVRLDDALTDLAKIDHQQSRIIELRFFAGLTIEEAAHSMGISPRTVKREWTIARAWLFRELSKV